MTPAARKRPDGFKPTGSAYTKRLNFFFALALDLTSVVEPILFVSAPTPVFHEVSLQNRLQLKDSAPTPASNIELNYFYRRIKGTFIIKKTNTVTTFN